MGEKFDRQALYSNLPIWWEHGIRGEGVTVWNCEGFTSHGSRTRQTIEMVAPEANVISGHVNYGTSKGRLKDAFVYIEHDKGREQTKVPLEEFLETYNVKIVTASLSPAPFSQPGYITIQHWKELIEKYDLCCFASSGNDYKRDKKMDNSDYGWWYVGATLYMSDESLKKAGYSNAGEGLDFTDFTADWSGTSFSSPTVAGKCALIRQRYPHMNRFEVYEYMKAHAADLGDPGEDTLFGHGLVILPDDFKEEEDDDMEVTKTKILVNGEVKEVKRILYKNENFIRLRDYQDVLGICEVDYDAKKNLPIVKKG